MNSAFQFHKLNTLGIEKAQRLATDFDSLLLKIYSTLNNKPGRELSIAITKLEEACFFAKKAMASDVANQEPVVP